MSDLRAKGGPERDSGAIDALYRAGADAEPPPALDRAILAAAQAELATAHRERARRASPGWRRWLPATTAVAALVIGLGVTLRVMDEQERRFREDAAGAAVSSAVAPVPPVPAPPATAETDRLDKAKTAPAPQAPRAVAPERAVPVASDAVAVPAEAASMPPVEARKKELRPETPPALASPASAARAESALRDAAPRATGALDAAVPAPAQALRESSAGAARPAAKAAASADVAGPEAWLARIRELKAAGRVAEAAQSLARLRERYPGVAIPADLADLENR